MSDCNDCPCRDLDAAKHALSLCERALAVSQERVETLRSQIVRLQQLCGLTSTMRAKQIADYCGVKLQTVQLWAMRYPDFPKRIPETYPHEYERREVLEFLGNHPRIKQPAFLPPAYRGLSTPKKGG